MAKKRKGIFRTALKGRLPVVQVLRDLGMSWAEIACHFKEDESLGGASARHFCSEWSRIHGMGLKADSNECLSHKVNLLLSDKGADWMIFRGLS